MQQQQDNKSYGTLIVALIVVTLLSFSLGTAYNRAIVVYNEYKVLKFDNDALQAENKQLRRGIDVVLESLALCNQQTSDQKKDQRGGRGVGAAGSPAPTMTPIPDPKFK